MVTISIERTLNTYSRTDVLEVSCDGFGLRKISDIKARVFDDLEGVSESQY